MQVYLDSVLHPKLGPNVLKQEGWHFELDEPDLPMIYKGVVFNEMKGVSRISLKASRRQILRQPMQCRISFTKLHAAPSQSRQPSCGRSIHRPISATTVLVSARSSATIPSIRSTLVAILLRYHRSRAQKAC